MEPVRAAAQDVGTDAQRESGKKLYDKYCSQCHGDKGDGEGYATPHLYPKPRNFTTGKYKVRTTPTGALPTHQDLVNIIRRGMPYTSMPAWPNLTDQEVSDLAHFLTTFSSEFANKENVPQPVPLPAAPALTKESVEAGRKLYEETGCIACHGTLGRGDGTSAPTMVDDFKQPIRPADLTQSWTFRGGSSREDIFRTMSTGFNGTPMPGFDDAALSPEKKWAITDYIASLSGEFRARLYQSRRRPSTFWIRSICRKGPRASNPPVLRASRSSGRSWSPDARSILLRRSVTVQAIYDAESIAVLVRWHDMSAEKAGTNGPSLPVPAEEDGTPPPAATPGGGADAANPFGDAVVTPAQAGAQPPADPFAEPAAPAAAAVRVLRCRRCADSIAGAGGRPEALFHFWG